MWLVYLAVTMVAGVFEAAILTGPSTLSQMLSYTGLLLFFYFLCVGTIHFLQGDDE